MWLKALEVAFMVLAFVAGFAAGHYAGFSVKMNIEEDVARKRLKAVTA